MKKNLIVGCILLTLMAAGSALAAETAQQQKMTVCNHQAKEKVLKGDERKAFMSNCLKKDNAVAKDMTPQQMKMKTCNAEAKVKNLKGDEHRAFMSTCLKKH